MSNDKNENFTKKLLIGKSCVYVALPYSLVCVCVCVRLLIGKSCVYVALPFSPPPYASHNCDKMCWG